MSTNNNHQENLNEDSSAAHSSSVNTNTKRQTRSQAQQQQQQQQIFTNLNLLTPGDTGTKQENADNFGFMDQKDQSEKGFELHRVATSDDDQDQNFQFYKEYCRLYYANIVLTNRLQHLLNEKQELQFKLNRLESNKRKHEEALGMTFDIAEEKRKRHRRTATEIARHYRCPIEDCPKSYGSEGSLNQHLKLKHLEFYQQLCSTNQINPVGLSKHDSTVNDEKSMYSSSYDEEDKHLSERDDDDDQSSDEENGHQKVKNHMKQQLELHNQLIRSQENQDQQE
eukprot:403331761